MKEPVYGEEYTICRLDVHAETIAVAVAEGRNQLRSLGTIANRPEAVRRLLGKLGKPTELKVCGPSIRAEEAKKSNRKDQPQPTA